MTISLSDIELAQVMSAAASLPVDQRGAFLQRIAENLAGASRIDGSRRDPSNKNRGGTNAYAGSE
jgi:hypothetical protein